MFYAQNVLNKKGPLARIWLAAHWDKKLTKANVFETDIGKSVDGILQPKVKLALRTSGHLMLGVVRIYSKKEKYLLADCNEAFVKIKMAFRPGMVDLPEEKREAAVNAITLPEVFHDFDTTMPELNDVDIQAQFTYNQSRAEEITMREDYSAIVPSTHHLLVNPSAPDDSFGDVVGFGDAGPELLRDATADFSSQGFEFNASMYAHGDMAAAGDRYGARDNSIDPMADSLSGLHALDPAKSAGSLGVAVSSEQPPVLSGGLFDAGDLFNETPMMVNEPSLTATNNETTGGLGSSNNVVHNNVSPMDDDFANRYADNPSIQRPSSNEDSYPSSPFVAADTHAPEAPGTCHTPSEERHADVPVCDTTLVRNENETFALPPIDTSVIRGMTRAKRKRKLVVDEVKNISGEEMKQQLASARDIIVPLDLAPPTKRLMHHREVGVVERLCALPIASLLQSLVLNKKFSRYLLTRSVEPDNDMVTTDDGLHSENQAPISQRLEGDKVAQSVRRKRRRDKNEPTEDDLRHQKLQIMQLEMMQNADNLNAEAAGDSLAIFDTEDHLVQPDDDEQLPTHVGANSHDKPHGSNQVTQPISSADNDRPENTTHNGVCAHLAEVSPAHTPSDSRDAVCEEDVQLEGETVQQFEDRVSNRRACVLFGTICQHLETQPTINFSQLCANNNRKQVAQKFYTALVLKKFEGINLHQTCSYDEIVVSAGPRFSSISL